MYLTSEEGNRMSIYEQLNKVNDRLALTEKFTHVGSYPYKYISDDYSDYNGKISEADFDNAWDTGRFPEVMWLESEADITKEGGRYQVSWGGWDDYQEFSSVAECKDEVESHYENFKWIKDNPLSAGNTKIYSSSATSEQIAAMLSKVGLFTKPDPSGEAMAIVTKPTSRSTVGWVYPDGSVEAKWDWAVNVINLADHAFTEWKDIMVLSSGTNPVARFNSVEEFIDEVKYSPEIGRYILDY